MSSAEGAPPARGAQVQKPRGDPAGLGIVAQLDRPVEQTLSWRGTARATRTCSTGPRRSRYLSVVLALSLS
jgi:hypothetical protein